MTNIAKTEPNNRPNLQKGDNWKWVVFLQDILNGCKSKPLDLDGDFGNNTTLNALKIKRFKYPIINKKHLKISHLIYNDMENIGMINNDNKVELTNLQRVKKIK